MEAPSFTHCTTPDVVSAPCCHLASRDGLKRPFMSHIMPQRLVRPEHMTRKARQSARAQRLSTSAALPESTEVVIIGAGKHSSSEIVCPNIRKAAHEGAMTCCTTCFQLPFSRYPYVLTAVS